MIGLRRQKYDNQKIIGLDKALKDIFASKNLHENLSKINGEYKDNELVREVVKFIEKDKKGRFVHHLIKTYDWVNFWRYRTSKIYFKKNKKKTKVFNYRFNKKKTFKKDKNSHPVSAGQFGKIISLLKSKNCKVF